MDALTGPPPELPPPPRRRVRWVALGAAAAIAVAGTVVALQVTGGSSSDTALPTPSPTVSTSTAGAAETFTDSVPEPPNRPTCAISKILVPSCGRWMGVAPGALTGFTGGPALAQFEAAIGRSVDIYHAYHVDDEVFPTAQEIAIARDPAHPRLLLLNWKPDRQMTWAQVAAGGADARIDALAKRLKTTFPDRFFLTIWHEPENDVKPEAGSGFTATDYAAMFRHVITRLRADGATGVVSVMTYIGSPQWGRKSWFPQLYPGDSVVDWIAFDPYISAAPQAGRSPDLTGLANRSGPGWQGFYSWATSTHRGKPIMIAEWGVFEKVGQPDSKAAIFTKILGDLSKFPQLKAMSYFDSPNAPRGNTSINSSTSALTAFRKLVNSSGLLAPLPPRS